MSASFLVVAMIFSLVIYRHFLSRLSNQFLMCEDGGELISFMTWAWVWQGIRIVDAFIIPSTFIHGRDIVVTLLVIPSTCIRGRDIVITPLVIPSTCICGRDIVIAPLDCVFVCLSVCLHLIAS